MAPGLTSAGGYLVPNLPEMAPVAVMAEGKKHAICIGALSMSSKAIETEKKGQAIEVVQFMNDALWYMEAV
jgi:PUA domain protein